MSNIYDTPGRKPKPAEFRPSRPPPTQGLKTRYLEVLPVLAALAAVVGLVLIVLFVAARVGGGRSGRRHEKRMDNPAELLKR